MTEQAKDPTPAERKPAASPDAAAGDGYGKCIKTSAATLAGISLGVIGGVAGIATAAVFEIVLPVSLCLWATGLAGGAIGLLLGSDQKSDD